jgi:hypothetical protein
MLCEPLFIKYKIIRVKFNNEEVLSRLFILIKLQVQLNNLLNNLIKLIIESL